MQATGNVKQHAITQFSVQRSTDLLGLLAKIDTEWADCSTEKACVLHRNENTGQWSRQSFDRGTVSNISINLKSLVKFLSDHNSDAIVLSHCHPGQSATPSTADIRTTRTVGQICSMFDVTLVDHIIFGQGPCFSFRSAGLL